MMLMTGISVHRGTVLTLAVAWFYVYPNYLCFVRNINGPQPTSLVFGNVIELFTKVSSAMFLVLVDLLLVQPAAHPPTDRCLVFCIIRLPWHVYVTHIHTFAFQDSSLFELKWSRAFGGIFRIQWAFGESRLYLSDPAALHHILVTACYSYPKPDQLRDLMSGALGEVGHFG